MSDQEREAARQRSKVQEIYSRDSDYYLSSQPHARSHSLQRSVEVLRPKGGVLLDVATGGGHTAFAMAPHCDSVIASDLTHSMLRSARKLGRSRGIGNVAYLATDAAALSLGSASLDWASVRIAPHHFSDITGFLEEVHRVLKAGGRFLFVDNVAPPSPEAATLYNHFEKLRDPSHHLCLTAEGVADAVVHAGFSVVHQEEIRKKLVFEAWTRRPHIDADLKRQLEELLGTVEPLEDWLRPRREEDGLVFDEVETLLLAEKAL